MGGGGGGGELMTSVVDCVQKVMRSCYDDQQWRFIAGKGLWSKVPELVAKANKPSR